MPGQKIAEADRRKIDAKFLCVVCGLLLVAPMQTGCGHLLCLACLQSLSSSKKAVCPVDGTMLIPGEIFPDAFTKRELMGVRLHCPNESCVWFGTYKELQDHLNSCGYTLIPCVHGQCKKEIQRSLLAKHLKQECDYRLVKCLYCDKELNFILLKKHVADECLVAPLTCQYCKKTNIRREEMEKHKTQDCQDIPVDCEFKAVGCERTKVMNRKMLLQHSDDSTVNHLQLLLRYVLGKVRNLIAELAALVQEIKQRVDSLFNQVKLLSEKLASVLNKLTGLEKKVESLESRGGGTSDPNLRTEFKKLLNRFTEFSTNNEKLVDRNRKIENDLREKMQVIERLRTKVEQLDDALALSTVKLADLECKESIATPTYSGSLLWKIDAFTRKRQDAATGVQTAMYSPPFYSGQYGYKMCARIYLNGDGFGKDTHISLFFVVMKGEYDALLPWPFQKKITMMLMDQNNGNHMIDAFRSDPQSSSFQRPKSNMNIASGSPLFMPVDGLTNRAYVKDDTVFVKIIVD